MTLYQITFTRRFLRVAKKLPRNIALEVHKVIKEISTDPQQGEKKGADLKDFYVVKFQPFDLQYLLAYTVNEDTAKIRLEAIGPHENFYRDLKRK